MDFFECIHKYLTENMEIIAVVNNRIYPFVLPQEPVLPSIVYQPINSVYPENLQKHSGFVRQTVQFTIHDKTFGKARTAGRKLKKLLQDFSGDMFGIDILATHLISDFMIGPSSQTQYDLQAYSNILECVFEYMEE